MKQSILILILIVSACSTHKNYSNKRDPLPSWQETRIKSSIIEYVNAVTNNKSADFIPVEDRIATFDNDGTLWAEMPAKQIEYAEDKAKRMGIEHPPLKQMNEKEILKLLMKTHTGMSTEEFAADVRTFFEKTKMYVYLPQVELLNYLMSNGFKVYICSGGTTDFMRVISSRIYHVPPEQVIGTTFEFKFDVKLNKLIIQPKVHEMNDKETKAHNIERVIGKRPVFAAGNVRSGGDIYMLRYSQGGPYRSYQLMINHDDKEREFAYQEKDNISLTWAKMYQWNVLSIKDDWKQVFTATSFEMLSSSSQSRSLK